jgi:dihydrosphingosine 1-phosphate phosphatase
MSGSAALEYGFPSTHSANAISVVVYILLALNANPTIEPPTRLLIQASCALYAFSILFGRIYCGMHGFLDVGFGTVMGAALAAAQWFYEDTIDAWIYGGHWAVPWIIIITVLFFVRIHPEPADNCPCFDDGVACIAVVMGVNVGQWHYAQGRFSSLYPVPGTVPYSLEELGWVKSVARILLGESSSSVGPPCLYRAILR